jgi:hypothetical protein
MSRRSIAFALALVLAIGVIVATTEIVLKDGRVVAGIEVRRDGDNYIIVLENGQAIVLPTALVETVRLGGEPEPEEEQPRYDWRTGLTRREPDELGAPLPEGAVGVVFSEPRQLAGEPVRAPTTQEQLAVFGKPAEFQKDIVDNSWEPSSDWNMDPETQNNFAPSTWSKDIVDNSWEPSSDWNMDPEKQNNFAPSTFSKNIIDNSWTPTDGFAR